VVPSLRLVADRDVVHAAKHLLVRTEIEAREIEEGKEIADIEEAAATSAVPQTRVSTRWRSHCLSTEFDLARGYVD
jgi:hypothetical protein